METNVRVLDTKDLDRVCEIEEASFSMPWKKEDFQHLLDDNASTYYVIEADGYLVGTAGYTFNGFEGYINNVVIDSDFRGKGLSRILMEKLLLDGKNSGVNEYTLEVRVSNAPAIRLYEGLGFKSEGVRKNFYERPTEDAYVMWLRY